jgi:hypothetical protein
VANHTVFGDLRTGAASVYRVQTQGSVYVIGVHEAKGRKYVVVRGLPGTDREHVVIRDSDPRVGESSLFDVPYREWVGKTLEVATMTTSTILAAEHETDPAVIAAVSARHPLARPAEPSAASHAGEFGELAAEAAATGDAQGKPARHSPPIPGGLSAAPRIQPGLSRGTLGGYYVLGGPPPADAHGPGDATAGLAAAKAAPAPAQKPQATHLRYAEDAAALLRVLVGHPSLFQDLTFERESLARLRHHLDDCAVSLETLRRRDRK